MERKPVHDNFLLLSECTMHLHYAYKQKAANCRSSLLISGGEDIRREVGLMAGKGSCTRDLGNGVRCDRSSVLD